jgi:hypothetical protein
VRIWTTKIFRSGFQKGFKYTAIAMIAGVGLGEGRVAFEHCYPDWGLHVGEVDKGFDTVTAYYVKLRLMRCGLAVARRLFHRLLCHLWCGCSVIYHIFRMRRKPSPRRIPAQENISALAYSWRLEPRFLGLLPCSAMTLKMN